MNEIEELKNLEVAKLVSSVIQSDKIIDQQEIGANLQQMPGQVFSKSDSHEILIQHQKSQNLLKLPQGYSSSSTEFDVDIFRNADLQTQQSKKLSENNENTNNDKSFLYFLGIKFQIASLLQRNKDPILVLKYLFVGCILLHFIFSVEFVIGLNFALLPLILYAFGAILDVIIKFSLIQLPIENSEVKPGIKLHILILIKLMCLMGLFVYCHLVQMPFNSILVFLLITYVALILFYFLTSLILTENLTPFDDPNYHLKFLAQRINDGFFNGTGLFDALSDIVLGIQLIQHSQKTQFLIIGIFLLVLCNFDQIQVVRRTLIPKKITLLEQANVSFIELVVLVLTSIVLFDVLKNSQGGDNDDFLHVTFISIATTLVNFSHNLVLLYSKIYPERQIFS